MSVRAFPIHTLPYGDSARPFATVVCGECGAEDKFNVSVGTKQVLPQDVIARRFSQKGWDLIGHGADRCPDCIEKARQHRKTTMNKTVVAIPANNAPRGPSRDEQRIIFEKVNDVYVDEKTGYSQGWSDQKVAVDMGVPRKWVEDIRAQFFGPVGTNPDMESFLAEYREVMDAAKPAIDEARRLRNEIDRMVASPVWNDIPKIADRLARLERTAEQLKKLLP